LAITQEIDWSGIECTDEGEISANWCWGKLIEKANAEALTVTPAFSRQGINWEANMRKENNSMRVILKESGIWTPEDPGGPPPMILFGPNAILKIRTSLDGPAAMSEMVKVLGILYQNRYSITEEVPSREWAIVGSFGDGVIPIQYRLQQPQVSQQEAVAINGSILEAGFRTQNYDKGFDKYVRKFNPKEESSAVVATHTGWQGNHGWAVAFKQGPRRCTLLDTTDELSSEEVFWGTLSAWVTRPRRFPGKLFYPDEASHILEECWNHLGDLGNSPGFSDKSPICQAAMLAFSKGVSRLNSSNWARLPTAEAPEKLAKIANNAAISRLRQIADGPNQWDMHRSSAGTDRSAHASVPMVGSESGPTSGLTDTCAGSSSPSHT
jgi:hypothetical protein